MVWHLQAVGVYVDPDPYRLLCLHLSAFNTLRPRQNGRHFADDTFKPIFLNENIRISIKISLNFVPEIPINNIPALVQIMAWRRPGDKPLSEPMMVCLLTHICVTRPQWVNSIFPYCYVLFRKQGSNELMRPPLRTWRLRSWSTLAQVMTRCLMTPSHYLTCCLMAPSHYLNQC